MQKGTVYNFYKDLPPWAKGVAVVATIAGVALLSLQIWKAIKKVKDSKDSKAVSNSAGNTLNDLIRRGEKLSFPQSNYLSAANTVEKLLDGCERVGSEIQVVETISRVVKKPIDWYYLVKVFGNRDIADCGTFGAAKTNYDLVTLVNDQLDTTIMGDSVNGKTYWNVDTLVPLQEHLSKIGITL